MENEETFNSKTSFIVNDGREGFQKWNGDQWEQVHFSGCSEEEMEDIESGLPMKVLKFMGLPKSYRHTLYNEFVQDVSLIPTETASSLKNIVSWICGQNEDGRSKNAKRSSMGQGDTSSQKYIMVNTTSSSESIGSTDSRVFRTDSMTNLKLITPFGVVVERKKSEKKPVQLLEAIELPSNISIATSMHELALEEKKEPQAHILELDHNGNVVRIPTRRPCASETSLYGCVMSETESEAEVSCKSAGTTPIVQSDKEDEGEGEEVKRVTFAPSSETNIYAYHDGDETEEDAESKMSHSEIDREDNEEKDGQENHQDTEIKSEEQDNFENHNQEHDDDEPQTETVLETPAASIKSCTSLHRVAVAKKKVSEEKVHMNDTPRSAAFSAWPHTNKENDSSLQKNPQSTVSEAQLQLNKDLKTLEEIVKKLYKNLNKKGPVTIVANFKPKKDGELALDMGGNQNPPGTILKKSRDSVISISHETEDEQKEHISAKESEAEIENVSSKTKENQNNSVRASRSRSRMTVPPKQPPVGIMKNSSKPATTQQPNSSAIRAHKPLSNLTKPPAIAPRLNKVTVNKVTVDKNNNIVEEPTLKPALRQHNNKSKMPSLRPAASSHSVSRTALVNKAEVHASPSRNSRSKHYLVRTSSSQHAIMEKPTSQQHYKIVEASNSKRYLVPVTPPRTSSQHVLVEAPPSQHLLLEPPNSNSQHILLESPLSQPIFLENLQQNQQVIREPQRPLQHILVETPPPPTCQNPHLHPRTATIIPPPSANTQFHGTSTPTISQSHQQGTYRYIQPCSMHSKYNHHPPQQQTSWSQHNLHDESAEETGSNTSRVSSASSTFSGVNGNYNSNSNTAPSGGETGTEEGIPIPIRITAKTVPASSSHHFQEQRQQQQQQQRSVTARKPSIMLNTRQKQSTENVMASSSGTNKQYRTTVHIPTGPPKPNSYRAIFKEKQQQQKQTVYVDLTSKGMRKNR